MTVAHPDTLVSYGYVSTSNLDMYYQVHGTESDSPILLLHGGLTTIESSFGALIPSLTRERRVIAVEQQGYGRTADIDRPMNFRSMANDTAEVLRSLDISSVDVFGYSDGGNVALGLAIAHPELVNRLAIAEVNGSTRDHCWTINELSSITRPILFIANDRDFARAEHAVELYRTFPTSRLAILPGTDHGMNLESPDALLLVLGEYFELVHEVAAA
jgi:pimeloyl-ACP methyl ester carboxylesterase